MKNQIISFWIYSGHYLQFHISINENYKKMNKNLKNILNFTRHGSNFRFTWSSNFFKEYRRKINYKFNNKRKPGMIQKRWNWFANNLEGGMKDQLWKLIRPLITWPFSLTSPPWSHTMSCPGLSPAVCLRNKISSHFLTGASISFSWDLSLGYSTFFLEHSFPRSQLTNPCSFSTSQSKPFSPGSFSWPTIICLGAFLFRMHLLVFPLRD